MTAAVIWLIAGLGLIGAELLVGEFTLLMLGGAALAGAGTAALFPDNHLLSVGVFALASVLLMLAVRPTLRRKALQGIDQSAMHHHALVGKTALVVSRVDGYSGQVKIGGDLWSARSLDGHHVIEPQARVIIMDITGATALVVPQD